MSQNARESLSALMDNEGDDLELRRVLKSLREAPDMADAWRRYHLMRSVLRRDHDVDISTDLSAGILARLEEEPLPEAAADDAPTRRSLPLARGVGVAAAVTLMVITGVQFYHGGAQAPGPEVAASREAGSGGEPVRAQRAFSLPDGYTQDYASMPSQAAPVGLSLFATGADGASRTPAFLTRASDGVGAALFPIASPRQSLSTDLEQARLLQSYLDRHAEGAAYPSGDAWMPLLRASGSETLGVR